jgi:two-component sensor histidine kinase
MINRYKNIRLAIFLNIGIGVVFVVAALIVVIIVNDSMRQQALREAQSKARIILDRNLATHTYFSKIMKPSIFAWSEPFRKKEYFDHTWMSSTYAVREIEKYFKSFNPSGYSFRDAANNARSPENEADEYERAFIEKLNIDEKLESESVVRTIDGKPYLIVLRKGEVMEASCLRCHSNPKEAPKGLTDYYGSERSFNRKLNDVASAVSLRIPLSEAYGAANIFSMKLSAILLIVLGALFIVQYWLYRRFLMEPLNVIRGKANQIASQEVHLGEQIPQPFGKELAELATSFNEMSMTLRYDRDHLEETIDKRTEALRESETRYHSLLDEKELLLKEVHHRIKNNMTTMMSFLTLQAGMQENAVARVLEDAGNRLRSMSILYDKLYRSENLREMPSGDYIIPLVNEIISVFPTVVAVKAEIAVDDLMLPVKLLSPLSIILNELITNIIKYAFSDRRKSKEQGALHENIITVTLKRNSVSQPDSRLSSTGSKSLTLTISDNGIGLPESIDPENTDSFGLYLVRIMTRQLKGKITVIRDGGTKFILEFEV